MAGAQWHRADIFPFPQLRAWKELRIDRSHLPPLVDKIVTRYRKGIPLFSDRTYIDSIGDPRLDGTFIIQIPRHGKGNIDVKFNMRVTVYRIVNEKTDNLVYEGWETTEIQVKVGGRSTFHNRLIRKDFPPGIVTFPLGAGISTSPILIKPIDYSPPVPVFELIDKNKDQ